MICADAKVYKNNKIWWLCFTNFYKKYFQNLKYNVKSTCIFQMILVGILSILMLSIKKSVKHHKSYLSTVP